MADIPAGCLVQECRLCDWHLIRGNKLDCNYRNRLGISSFGLKGHIGGFSDEDLMRRRLEAKVKETKEMEELLTKMKKVKKGKDKGLVA